MANPVWWIADQVKSIARIERMCEGKQPQDMVRSPLGDSRPEPVADHLARAEKMRQNIANAVTEYGQLAIDAANAVGYEWPQSSEAETASVNIEKLDKPEHSGDWHDPPLKWKVVGPNGEIQKFHNREEARRYRRCRIASATANEAGNRYLRESF